MPLSSPGNLIAFQLINIALWAAAFAIGIAIVYGLNVPKRYALPPDNVQTTEAINIAYGGLSRFSWAVAVSWVIFACCRGYGGVRTSKHAVLSVQSFLKLFVKIGWINDFLSWEAWQPLSKISFIVYLIHYDFLQIFNEKGNQWDFGQDLTPSLLVRPCQFVPRINNHKELFVSLTGY